MSGQLFRSTPWLGWAEWLQVMDWVYPGRSATSAEKPSAESLRRALDRIEVWRTRQGSLPLAVDSTAALLRAQLSDHFGTASAHELRLLYSSAIIRFVNGLVDRYQTSGFAKSVTQLARQIDLPRLFVDIRHASTHGRLPSLHVLRVAARRALRWWLEKYWEPQLASVQGCFEGFLAAMQRYLAGRRQQRQQTPAQLLRWLGRICQDIPGHLVPTVVIPVLFDMRNGLLVRAPPASSGKGAKAAMVAAVSDFRVNFVFEKLAAIWAPFLRYCAFRWPLFRFYVLEHCARRLNHIESLRGGDQLCACELQGRCFLPQATSRAAAQQPSRLELLWEDRLLRLWANETFPRFRALLPEAQPSHPDPILANTPWVYAGVADVLFPDSAIAAAAAEGTAEAPSSAAGNGDRSDVGAGGNAPRYSLLHKLEYPTESRPEILRRLLMAAIDRHCDLDEASGAAPAHPFVHGLVQGLLAELAAEGDAGQAPEQRRLVPALLAALGSPGDTPSGSSNTAAAGSVGVKRSQAAAVLPGDADAADQGPQAKRARSAGSPESSGSRGGYTGGSGSTGGSNRFKLCELWLPCALGDLPSFSLTAPGLAPEASAADQLARLQQERPQPLLCAPLTAASRVAVVASMPSAAQGQFPPRIRLVAGAAVSASADPQSAAAAHRSSALSQPLSTAAAALQFAGSAAASEAAAGLSESIASASASDELLVFGDPEDGLEETQAAAPMAPAQYPAQPQSTADSRQDSNPLELAKRIAENLGRMQHDLLGKHQRRSDLYA